LRVEPQHYACLVATNAADDGRKDRRVRTVQYCAGSLKLSGPIGARHEKVNTEIRKVSELLDAYWERCLKPARLRSAATVRSQIGVLKTHLGSLSLPLLEEPDDISHFKTDSEYADDVELTSMHRVLERLRAAINWGMAQTPPLLAKSPFHRLGVRLNKKAEDSRDRRLPRDEEKRLLDTALKKMNAPRPKLAEASYEDGVAMTEKDSAVH